MTKDPELSRDEQMDDDRCVFVEIIIILDFKSENDSQSDGQVRSPVLLDLDENSKQQRQQQQQSQHFECQRILAPNTLPIIDAHLENQSRCGQGER